MASNNVTSPCSLYPPSAHHCGLAAVAAAVLVGLSGCSVMLPRESPINEMTKDSPTVIDIYRQATTGGSEAKRPETARDRLAQASMARPIGPGDGDSNRYWSALEPMNQRFARVPNPDLVMVVYPHLAQGKYPVPGYVTTFPMYEEVHYALPGEVAEGLAAGQRMYRAAAANAKVAAESGKSPLPTVATSDSRIDTRFRR